MPFDKTTYPYSTAKTDTAPKPENDPMNVVRKNEAVHSYPETAPKYELKDLIISDAVFEELKTIMSAEKCRDIVFEKWNLKSVLGEKRNLFVNLYGHPGTGKTMAAHAIASALGKKIICVNYAEIESKYVGETSKNLSALFRQAGDTGAVIFFDEADAFLSKRVTNMNNSTDVSVNQTRSVLLTLLNDYKGIVIFATNFISNYDRAFMRRIQFHVKFELPDLKLREKLWRMYIPAEMPTDVNIPEISEKYSDISGSDISTAVLKAALSAAQKGLDIVPGSYFETAIEGIVASKRANDNIVKVETREVSEEYALSQINKNGGQA